MPNINDLIHEIDWMPIDIPKFPYPADVFNPTYDANHAWKYDRLTTRHDHAYAASQLQPDVIQRFPLLKDWLRHLPYTSVRNIKVNFQHSPVRTHVDFKPNDLDPQLYDNNQCNEPCGYRVLLRGSRNQALFLSQGEERIFPIMPDDTDVYVLRQTQTVHGVEDDPGRVVMYIHLEIDPALNHQLLVQSYRKYAQFAIFRS
jgi:hypothetical protein